MTMEQFKEQFREQADKQVKMRLAMEAIVAKESIEATEEEFEAEIKRIADAYQMEADKVKSLVDAGRRQEGSGCQQGHRLREVQGQHRRRCCRGEEAREEDHPQEPRKKAAAKKDEEPKEEETQGRVITPRAVRRTLSKRAGTAAQLMPP